MPYRRGKVDDITPDKLLDWLVKPFEKAIVALVERFKDHPYKFYTETDMHCYLYHRLHRGHFNDLYRTAEGRTTSLLHKEYPTNAIYGRNDDKTLREDKKGRRGHFDISVWDPRYISTLDHRKQKVLIAAELALNECGTSSVHTLNDATKLAGPTNEIQYGYLLYFVRDSTDYRRNERRIRQELDDAATRVSVVFCRAETSNRKQTETWYGGNWLTAPISSRKESV